MRTSTPLCSRSALRSSEYRIWQRSSFALAEDHRILEGRSGPLVNLDGSDDVADGGSVHVPVSQVVDDLGRGRGVERLGDLPRRGDNELLQHLNAYAA